MWCKRKLTFTSRGRGKVMITIVWAQLKISFKQKGNEIYGRSHAHNHTIKIWNDKTLINEYLEQRKTTKKNYLSLWNASFSIFIKVSNKKKSLIVKQMSNNILCIYVQYNRAKKRRWYTFTEGKKTIYFQLNKKKSFRFYTWSLDSAQLQISGVCERVLYKII